MGVRPSVHDLALLASSWPCGGPCYSFTQAGVSVVHQRLIS